MINLKDLIYFLPFQYKDGDTYKVDDKGILERFLTICGTHFEDEVTKDIDNILDIIDIDNTDPTYLNYLWEFLGEIPYAKKGDRIGPLALNDDRVRNLLKYSITLLKIRGSKKFFEILFDLYGLTCSIVDPTEGDMDLWERSLPQYDTSYSLYDKYNFDRSYGCSQCINIKVTIGGHPYGSATKEFISFKQSIDGIFDRFLPYNVSCTIDYGFELKYNYRIQAEALVNPPSIIVGHISEIPIKVTVTSDFDDADLRYQVTGYTPSDNKWSSKKYNPDEIFYARKGDQRYYFRSVGDPKITTFIDIGSEYFTKSYHIYAELISGGTDLSNLAITGTNSIIQIKVNANMTYDGRITQVPVQSLNTHETRPSGYTWEITKGGTYEWVISEFPSKRILISVSEVETTYKVICEPRNINISSGEESTIVITSSNPDENVNELEAILTTDSSIKVKNGDRWKPSRAGTYMFRCTKDTSDNPSNLGTILAYELEYNIVYKVEVEDSRLELNSIGEASTLISITSGIHYSTFESANLYKYFDKNVNLYKKVKGEWDKIDTRLLSNYYSPAPDYFYGGSRSYTFKEVGEYKIESIGDPSKAVIVIVTPYVPSSVPYLWLEPLDDLDTNWYELKTPSESTTDVGKYTTAGYQLTKVKTCKFKLQYGSGVLVSGITLEGTNNTYNTDEIIEFKEPGSYVFEYQGTIVKLTVSDIIPNYNILIEPPSAEIKDGLVGVVTTITCTSDTERVSDIIYETIPDTAHKSPYQFTTTSPGKHTFYLKDNPSIKGVFLVELPWSLDKTELRWGPEDLEEQSFNINVPNGVKWKITTN